MKNKLKRTTSMLCALTVAAVPMAVNAVADINDSGVSAVPMAFDAGVEINNSGVSVGQPTEIGDMVVEDYTLTIPASFDIKNEGWNEIGDISVTGQLADGRKLVVNAESDGEFALVNQSDDAQKIGYTLKNSADGEETTSWEFEELSETPVTQKIGVDVEQFKDKPAGSYTDTVTFTAGVETMYNIVDLSALTANYEAQDGDILTGTLAGNYKITVADGATITLNNAVIRGRSSYDYKWAGITPNGDATIILEGENSLRGFYTNYPGITVPEGKTLAIKGNGSLDASSNGYGSGIGGGYRLACGNIIIESGTITAAGGYNAAGIGDGSSGSCGNITINGGTVTATGGERAPGIGSGYRGSCGAITIANTVTKVTATKGENAPNSIGAGNSGTCGDVIIGGKKKGNISESPYTYEP